MSPHDALPTLRPEPVEYNLTCPVCHRPLHGPHQSTWSAAELADVGRVLCSGCQTLYKVARPDPAPQFPQMEVVA